MRIVRTDVYCRFVPFFVAMACVLALYSCHTTRPLRQARERSIVILYENDVHCAIDGYASMAQLRDAVADTAWVALTSSGDFLQGGTAGALSRGQYIADIMRAMRYDAVALGNHEFDFGIPHMKQLLRTAALPVTCVNLRDLSCDSIVYTPYIIKTYGNKRIAFVGVTTPSAFYTEQYAFRSADGLVHHDLCETEVYALVQKAVDEARGNGADYVVALSHLGESDSPLNVNSHGLVAATSGIDAVLDGHSHSVVECCMVKNRLGRMIPVTQTGTQFANIGKLLISPDGGISTHLVPVPTLLSHKTGYGDDVRCVVDSVKALMSEVIKEEVCRTSFPLSILDSAGRQRVRYAETNAGNVVTDALRAYTGADVAIMNGGGIRTGIAEGIVTVGDVVAMMPYDNAVAVLQITGGELLALLEACCGSAPRESGDFPQVSGISFRLCNDMTPRVRDLQILDASTGVYRPIDLPATYSLATIEYDITGGGLHDMLRTATRVKDYQTTDTQVVIWYLNEKLRGVLTDDYRGVQGRIR